MPSTLVPGAMHTDQDTWGWLGQDWGSDEMSEGEDWDSASSDTLPGTPLVGWKATSLPPALGEDAGAADEGRSWGRSW
ncbi:Protein of unknown function [Pyronema omphalodes CBS 100304]|uniref:Uncharacterized protein n=1 Tax=Pyronema omphalodes (strain CBS 100304) TaxID=1076935 RepID=U4KW42_PYROM|nr:Protein of unknown function [Pyronema omphalodes CBS 100304]